MAGVPDSTTAQNIVTAINNLGQNYLAFQGQKTSLDISTSTVVKQGGGRVTNVVVTTTGTTPGTIYDGNGVSSTSGKIYTIPNAIGLVVLNMPVTAGIVVAPGTGQVVSISYS